MREKIKTYLGFARRAGKLTLGVAAVGTLKRDVFLLIADESASPNTKKEIERLRKKFGCPFVETSRLEELADKAEVKLVAVREEHLAAAAAAEFAKSSSEE